MGTIYEEIDKAFGKKGFPPYVWFNICLVHVGIRSGMLFILDRYYVNSIEKSLQKLMKIPDFAKHISYKKGISFLDQEQFEWESRSDWERRSKRHSILIVNKDNKEGLALLKSAKFLSDMNSPRYGDALGRILSYPCPGEIEGRNKYEIFLSAPNLEQTERIFNFYCDKSHDKEVKILVDKIRDFIGFVYWPGAQVYAEKCTIITGEAEREL